MNESHEVDFGLNAGGISYAAYKGLGAWEDQTIAKMSFKDINVAASAILPVHATLVDYIKEGVIKVR